MIDAVDELDPSVPLRLSAPSWISSINIIDSDYFDWLRCIDHLDQFIPAEVFYRHSDILDDFVNEKKRYSQFSETVLRKELPDLDQSPLCSPSDL